ncbi:Hypothetical predicted protein, partial [Olea europaea subsp. europaea]
PGTINTGVVLTPLIVSLNVVLRTSHMNPPKLPPRRDPPPVPPRPDNHSNP